MIGHAQQVAELEERLAAANNVIAAAATAISAAELALGDAHDNVASDARRLCRQFQVRRSVYAQTGR